MPNFYERQELHNVVGMISYGLSDSFEERKKQFVGSPLNRTNLPPVLDDFLAHIDIRWICGLVVECTNKKFRWPGILRVMDLSQVLDLAHPEEGRIVAHEEMIYAARTQKPNFYRDLLPRFKDSEFVSAWILPSSEIVVVGNNLDE